MDYIIPPSLKGTQGLDVSDCDPMSVYQSIFLNILGMPCLCKPKHVFKNSLFCLTTLSSSNDTWMSIILKTKKLRRIIGQMVDTTFLNLQIL